MHKKIFVITVFVVISVLGLIFYRQPARIIANPAIRSFVSAEPTLRIIFFDVGQGDAALIITPQNQTILVDGGPDDKVLSKLGKYLPLYQRKIDYMILSHPHADHLDGLVSVLKRYEVGEVYYSGVPHTTFAFLEWLELIKQKNIAMKIVDEPQVLELDSGVSLDFLYPNKDLSGLETQNQEESKFIENNELNNVSIVFKLIYGQTSFLFTGDAETPVEEGLLRCASRSVIPTDATKGSEVEGSISDVVAKDSSPAARNDKKLARNDKRSVRNDTGGGVSGDRSDVCNLRANVLKVGHHGSRSSTSEKFLQTVQPQMAVISSGIGNDFGHPHLRTLRRLERHGVKIFRTDLGGDVKVKSDGEGVMEE